MSDDLRQRLQQLGSRIDEARGKHASQHDPADARFQGEPLTHVFDDWNDEVRHTDDKIGRLHVEEQIAVIFVLAVFLLSLNWLWPR